jgi:hypothetical protein
MKFLVARSGWSPTTPAGSHALIDKIEEEGLTCEEGFTTIHNARKSSHLLKDEETTMISSGYFERLVTSVERIARHAYYPGIDEAIDQCLEDIDELMHEGRITAEEREALRMVLLGITLTASNNTSHAA